MRSQLWQVQLLGATYKILRPQTTQVAGYDSKTALVSECFEVLELFLFQKDFQSP